MNNLSFELRTAQDLLEKLKVEYGHFLSDRLSVYNAINCAMTAWHLTEWVFWEQNPGLDPKERKAKEELKKFKSAIKKQCRALKIMEDISNGTKHFNLNHPTEVVKTILYMGNYSSAYSRAYNISRLEGELESGDIFYFEDEIQTAVEFWEVYLNPL